jgi:hypothetical protein
MGACRHNAVIAMTATDTNTAATVITENKTAG